MNIQHALVLTALAFHRSFTRRTAGAIATETGYTLAEVESVLNDEQHKPYLRKIERNTPARESDMITDQATDQAETSAPVEQAEAPAPLYEFNPAKFELYRKLLAFEA